VEEARGVEEEALKREEGEEEEEGAVEEEGKEDLLEVVEGVLAPWTVVAGEGV